MTAQHFWLGSGVDRTCSRCGLPEFQNGVKTRPPCIGSATPPPPTVLEGTCAVCGQLLLVTADDCWHPHTVSRACPPEPSTDPYDAPGWQRFYAQGLKPLRPGRENFRPDPDTEATRAYVSRLWAEDWNSPADAVYDTLEEPFDD